MKISDKKNTFQSRAIQNEPSDSKGTKSLKPPPLFFTPTIQKKSTNEHGTAGVIQRSAFDIPGIPDPAGILRRFISEFAEQIGDLLGPLPGFSVDLSLLSSSIGRAILEQVYLSFLFTGEIDHTSEAVLHYYLGRGRSVRIGPNTRSEVQNSDDQQYYLSRIRDGHTSGPASGRYGVNMEDESARSYHLGNTPIHYSTVCDGSSCKTTFTSRGDGFWDIFWGNDQGGSEGELGGTGYAYRPFSWTETFPNPGYPIDADGIPSPIPGGSTPSNPPSHYYDSRSY